MTDNKPPPLDEITYKENTNTLLVEAGAYLQETNHNIVFQINNESTWRSLVKKYPELKDEETRVNPSAKKEVARKDEVTFYNLKKNTLILARG